MTMEHEEWRGHGRFRASEFKSLYSLLGTINDAPSFQGAAPGTMFISSISVGLGWFWGLLQRCRWPWMDLATWQTTIVGLYRPGGFAVDVLDPVGYCRGAIVVYEKGSYQVYAKASHRMLLGLAWPRVASRSQKGCVRGVR